MDKGKINLLNNKAKIIEVKLFLVTHSATLFFHLFQDNIKLDKEPAFPKVTYSDSGRYECHVTMGLLSQKASFELAVEGEGFKDNQTLLELLF